MIRLLTSLAGVIFILIHINHAQVYPEGCPSDGPTPPGKDPKWPTIPPRFEIITELVSDDNTVVEIAQAFSTYRDTIAKNFATTPVLSYWNYQLEEHLKVTMSVGPQPKIPTCTRRIITSDTQTSVTEDDSLYLKPSVIFGFDPRNQENPNWGIAYEDEGSLRDIPTTIFKSCFYISDINATAKVIYHVANATNFQTYAAVDESIILQLDVNITNSLGRQQAYTYNVFRYIANPSVGQEHQALETPSGIYCVNRTTEISVPSDIPDRVSSNSEAYIPTFNKTIFSSHNLYDSEYQFSRFEAWYPDLSGGPDWIHRTEMNDFAVGLSYHYDHSSRRCTVNDINVNTSYATPVDGNPSLIQMGNPQHVFLLDDITYQYTGEKRCRDGVLCNVWIGENHFPNNTIEHREWYWATKVNNRSLARWVPMKLVTKRYDASGNLTLQFEMSFFNYRRDPMTIFEIDYTLAECFRALGPAENFNLGVLSFKIANDKKFPVMQHINYLRLHIWETLLFTLFIRPIRISNLIVDQDENDILVTFTLLDAPPRTGPVEVPLLESSLDTLIERLTKIIDANGLTFRAQYGTSKQTVLRARVGTLNIAHLSTQQKALTSGPLITGLWIGCVLVGLLIGGVGSFFLFQKVATK